MDKILNNLNKLNISNNFKTKLLSELNEEQLSAVISLDGNFLVLAGAGTGKTRIIIYRSILLLELKIKPESILVVTFTRKAANEIKDRIKKYYENENQTGNIYIETFHSLAYKFLKKFSTNKTFNILTSDNIDLIINKFETLNSIKNIFDINFIKKFILLSEQSFYKNSYYKNLNKKEKELIQKFLEEFEQIKIKYNYYTFSDLLSKFLYLLKINSQFFNFEYIMVDEYQDTDDTQLEILKLLSKNQNLFVVGDDFQSIYGFKGTSMKNILNFQEHFDNTHTIILKKNYRSNSEILNLSNEVSKKLKYCFKKILQPNTLTIKKPELNIYKNSHSELSSIYEKIITLISYDSNSTIAILFRNYIFMENFINYFESKNLKFNLIPNIFLENIFKDKIFSENSNLILTTIHSSKGLEWDYVFIPLLLDGIIPSSISNSNSTDIEEEKRLFYVAITRAKKGLFLSYPLNFYGDYGFFSSPSPFIETISSNFLEIKQNT